jgi:sulfate adenylyltransferase
MILGEPYGGRLVNRLFSPKRSESLISEATRLPKVKPFLNAIYDAEKIAVGAYSPLEGFMGQDTYTSVINKNRLSNGLPWTIPIILTPPGLDNSKVLETVNEGEDLVMLDWTDKPFAILHIEDKFKYDKKELAKQVYGTVDEAHPNVFDIYHNQGDTAIGGKLDLVRRLELPAGSYEMTPQETRDYFKKMEWKNVLGYQCRNPPHTAHEYIQRISLEREEIDGLLVHPVVGRLKKGDYKPEIIMQAYQELVDAYYPKNMVLLASISITMRYGGPKAALFLAIVRKNYGCTHYIVGRDQAGVGDYYDAYACHRIFDEYNVGIVPLRYRETHFCRRCGWMASQKTCPHPKEDYISTSQTKIRETLREGKAPPTEILRPEVAKVLMQPDLFVS